MPSPYKFHIAVGSGPQRSDAPAFAPSGSGQPFTGGGAAGGSSGSSPSAKTYEQVEEESAKLAFYNIRRYRPYFNLDTKVGGFKRLRARSNCTQAKMTLMKWIHVSERHVLQPGHKGGWTASHSQHPRGPPLTFCGRPSETAIEADLWDSGTWRGEFGQFEILPISVNPNPCSNAVHAWK